MSKYIDIYEKVFDLEKVPMDDPRRAAIISEMIGVAKAKTEAKAADIIRSYQFKNEADLFASVRKIRTLASKV